jgi:hypothetical protein
LTGPEKAYHDEEEPERILTKVTSEETICSTDEFGDEVGA